MSGTRPLFDSHCHIHEPSYPDGEAAYRRAVKAGVKRLLCVGTDPATSRAALAFAAGHNGCLASVGLHPHEAEAGRPALESVWQATEGRPAPLSAIGECGLDYHYGHASRRSQLAALHFQIELALRLNLPLIFHIREAFEDFWPVFDSYAGQAAGEGGGLRGVLHSFTDSPANLARALERGLFIGINGIATFSRDPGQQAVWRQAPLERVLLETDSPFLTPAPLRGKVNEPAYIVLVARYLAELKGLTVQEIVQATACNATSLFIKPPEKPRPFKNIPR